MKGPLTYIILMPLCYALLLWLGYKVISNQTPQEEWIEQAAPWLGEPPADLSTRRMQENPELKPYTIFIVPATAEMKARFHRAFPVDEQTNPLGNFYARYPEWSQSGLSSGAKTISPEMQETSDGRLFITIDNPNAQKSASSAPWVEPTYTQYLDKHPNLTMCIDLLIGFATYLFPSLFCCAGWLWVQKQRVRSADTFIICFLLPFIVAPVAFYILSGEYDGIVTILGLILMAALNIACSLALIALTSIVRLLKATVSCKPHRSVTSE